jgi:hypothetical protein
VLLVEILGDLKKHRDPEKGPEEVRILANKLMPACSAVNADFRTLIRGELMGHRFSMDGRPVLLGGKHVVAPGGKKGVVFETSQAEKALHRWQTGDFRAAEELMAEAWRLSSKAISLEAMQRQLRSAYSGQVNLGTLSQTATFVDELMGSKPPRPLVQWFLSDAGLLTPNDAQLAHNLKDAPLGSLAQAAPFTAYCVRAALIFHFALAFGLVSTRPTNRIDLEYLYYAPFGNAFSSGDAFHRKTAALILRDQTYIHRDALKADLGHLAQWWNSLDKEQQAEEGRLSGPPENDASVTHQLWKKLMKPGYRDPKRRPKLSDEAAAKMLQEYQSLIKGNLTPSQPPTGQNEDYDFMMVQHEVRRDGPCICGSGRNFEDCCGRGIVTPRAT